MSTDSKPGSTYWNVIEPVWNKISIYDGGEVFVSQFSALKPAVGDLYAVHWCQSEVRNGGFYQFFTNSTGVLAPEALVGFKNIGLDDCADALQEAMKYFGQPYPREQEDRYEKLPPRAGNRAEWDPFYDIDERFYKALKTKKDRFERAADLYAAEMLG
jgi:hypothetical protein